MAAEMVRSHAMLDAKNLVIPDPNCLSATAMEQKAETVGVGKATNEPGRVFMPLWLVCRSVWARCS